MTVYVDSPVFTKTGADKPRKRYAHMVADTLQELHAFAAQIGIKEHFFHRARAAHHYGITAEQHAIALDAGAKLVRSGDLLRIGRKACGKELSAAQ